MYRQEYERITCVLEAVTDLVNYTLSHPTTYPSAVIAYNALLYGIVPNIRVTCPHCRGELIAAPKVAVGGLDDALLELEKAFQELSMEVEWGEEDAPDDHSSDGGD